MKKIIMLIIGIIIAYFVVIYVEETGVNDHGTVVRNISAIFHKYGVGDLNFKKVFNFKNFFTKNSRVARPKNSTHAVSELPIPQEYEDFRDAYAHYYDPTDPAQTKPNADGIGSSMRRVESGSVAMTEGFIASITNNNSDIVVFIQIEGSTMKTPYGVGIFRVDDTKNSRYVGDYVEFIREDFFQIRNNSFSVKRGEYFCRFRIYKIERLD